METLIEILIDNSNSMGPFEVEKGNKEYLLPDGSTRMELAKKILIEEIIPKIEYANKITIRKFHSVTNAENSSKSIISTIYDGVYSIENLKTKIEEIEIPKNTGGTPITAAVELSINELGKYPNADRKIILVTDGQEDKGGDYKKTAEEALKQLGIPCNIFIIGISQNKLAESISKELAIKTGGSYVNLKTKIYNKINLQNELRPIYFKAVNASIQNIVVEKKLVETQKINPIIEKQTISSYQKDTSTIEKEIVENQTNRLSVYEEIIQNNSTAIKLISKQLISITEAIESLKKDENDENDENEEIEITENEQINNKVGKVSENYLNNLLREKFGTRLKWLNENGESGQFYDFEVLDTIDNSTEYFIECKASKNSEKIFYLTKNEWNFFLENKTKYQLYFISNALTDPQLTKIDNLMEHIITKQVVPYSNTNIKLKAERIVFTILN